MNIAIHKMTYNIYHPSEINLITPIFIEILQLPEKKWVFIPKFTYPCDLILPIDKNIYTDPNN